MSKNLVVISCKYGVSRALLHFHTPPRVRVRATLKLSAAFFYDESSITIGGVRTNAMAPFLANLVFNFHSGFSITLTFLLVNVYLTQNMKKSHWNTSSFVFFTTLDLIWPKFCPKDHTHFTFFDWFPMKYVRGYN